MHRYRQIDPGGGKSAKTALPIRQIVSEIIVQAENLIDIEDANEEREED